MAAHETDPAVAAVLAELRAAPAPTTGEALFVHARIMSRLLAILGERGELLRQALKTNPAALAVLHAQLEALGALGALLGALAAHAEDVGVIPREVRH